MPWIGLIKIAAGKLSSSSSRPAVKVSYTPSTLFFNIEYVTMGIGFSGCEWHLAPWNHQLYRHDLNLASNTSTLKSSNNYLIPKTQTIKLLLLSYNSHELQHPPCRTAKRLRLCTLHSRFDTWQVIMSQQAFVHSNQPKIRLTTLAVLTLHPFP